MLLVAEAEATIQRLVQPFSSLNDSERIDLPSAIGRVLAIAACSSLDFPHWDNSAMDGYAVRYEDVKSCHPEQTTQLAIVEEIPAGQQPHQVIQPGQCARIFTGSMMPEGADTVVMQEHTQRQGGVVTILQAPAPNAFVRYRGEFYKAEEPLLPAGIRLSAPELAVLAAAQCTPVSVFRRPVVALLSTGSELVAIDQPLQSGQIVDSNQVALSALVSQAGAEAWSLGVIPDQPERLRTAIAHAITKADVVISSGGVSVGDYDYVDEMLMNLGAQIQVRAVAIKPGKPLTVATFPPNETRDRPVLYFGLPGNPVSALVTFWRFVQPALKKLAGLRHGWEPSFIWATTRSPLKADGKRESYIWGRLQIGAGGFEFEPAGGSHSSGNLINLAQTNGLAVLPMGQTTVATGDRIQVMLTHFV
jgi:molybdopterin molybdotransferase